MIKKLFVILAVIILIGVFFVFRNYKPAENEQVSNEQNSLAQDYKNATYEIEGEKIQLQNGASQNDSTTTSFFGNEAEGDLDGNGTTDVAFLLAQDGGGSGIFYYIVVALKTNSGYQGTNAVFLGDRIAPQTTEIHGNELVVNYAERRADEPMTAEPSVGVSKYLKVSDGRLSEITKQ